MKKKILVLKDDAAIKPGLNSALIDEGYEARVANTSPDGADDANKFIFGETVVDFKRHEVYKSGQRQEVTNREFKLLEYFIQHPGEVLTRDRLLDEIWGYSVYPTTRTVDNHILRLRKHVEPKPGDPVYIKTVRGAGYLFDLG